MNVDSIRQQKSSKKFREMAALSFDLDQADISFSCIDTSLNRVMSVTTNYQWHLNYWGHDLDKQLAQRLVPGIVSWNRYDPLHQSILKENMPSRKTKIDICTRHSNIFELMSVSTDVNLEFMDVGSLLKIKPKISTIVGHTFKKHGTELSLPLRSDMNLGPASFTSPSESPFQSTSTWQFGDLTLTELEMDTVRQLLMCRSIKEIANKHNCNEKVERKRLDNIKRKMDSEGHPVSYLFDKLKENGVVQTCLESFIMYQ
ncbi:hypothetical protein [Serratia liquefaciens]|uniref:hypothetical protein n=1 Tax=Serratia liquefaciens TaxID=614 RepID=UPI00390697E4